ncbi:MAG: hypothetical protein JO370_11965, partial [Paucibacter sp.]|nr:hypothetical protein [Roseateles sp.]
MATPAPAFYADWTFWSFVAAATAILLSQLPPARQWFKSAKLVVEVYGKVGVTHMLGYPGICILVGLRNVGGKSIRVRAAKVRVTRDGNAVGVLEGSHYFPTLQAPSSIVFTPFFLPAGGEWIHTFQFVAQLSQIEDRALGQLRADVRLDINNGIREARNANPQHNALVHASPELVRRMEDVIAAKFVWTPGEYEMLVTVYAEGGVE